MPTLLKSPYLFQLLALTGALFAILGSLIAGFAYRGKDGESYSILNHFISELGEVGVSRRAWAFNWGLILSGPFVLLACISLGMLIPGVWSKVGMAAGIVCSISLSLVGVYPMNNLTPHSRAATAYFRSGLGMVIFFTLAVALQPGSSQLLPPLYSLAGLPAILSFSFFLVYSGIVFRKAKAVDPPTDPPPAPPPRPRFWGLAFSEWTIFLTIVPFFFIIALGL